MQCDTCFSQGELDASLGHVVCTECGKVLEENSIVAELQFAEKASGAAVAEGFTISLDQARAKTFGRMGGQRSTEESRERILERGNRRIQQVGSVLQMSQRQIESAQRYFNLAVINNFNKGRRGASVAAACLYIVCRLEKTSHMLIDFADILQINVYVLGATFLKLVQILHLRLPLVDPALYVARFAARLEFENLTQKVISDSLRLIQRMNRDWIHVGRRPAGICAAGLFIAARMNGFKRSIREIIQIVKICELTLKKRLMEFKETPSGELSVADFFRIWLEEGADPPAFTQKKAKHLTTEEDEVHNEELELEASEYLKDTAATEALNTLNQEEEDEDLSKLDVDEEVQDALLSKEEIEFKSFIWHDEHEDWIEQQALKAHSKMNEPLKKPTQRRKRKATPSFSGATAAEAAKNLVQSKPALSRKINYAALESIFEEE